MTPEASERAGTWGTRDRLLTLPFALRPDFVATVQVPRDLTEQEAKRLAAMILTLPIPTDSAVKEPS